MSTEQKLDRFPQTEIEVALAAGGGYIPQSGIFSATVWGRFLGISTSRFCQWIKEFNIPFRKPGAEIFVDAKDLLQAFAKKRHSDEVPVLSRKAFSPTPNKRKD